MAATPVTASSQWPRYHYRARLLRVVDGDTVELMVDLGFGVNLDCKVRLAGYNAPELHGLYHSAAVDAARTLEAIMGYGPLLIRTHKDSQSFERYVADVYRDIGGAAPLDVAAAMRAAGYDVPRGQ